MTPEQTERNTTANEAATRLAAMDEASKERVAAEVSARLRRELGPPEPKGPKSWAWMLREPEVRVAVVTSVYLEAEVRRQDAEYKAEQAKRQPVALVTVTSDGPAESVWEEFD